MSSNKQIQGSAPAVVQTQNLNNALNVTNIWGNDDDEQIDNQFLVTENPFFEDDSTQNEIIDSLTTENNQLKSKV